MEAALEAARAKDTKERLAGVERLHEALDAAARRGLSPAEVTSLVDTCVDLTRDANFRVAQGGLQALSAAAVLAGDHFKIHLNALVPAAVERLGDGKQPVREAARQLLVTLMEVSSPTIILERAGNYAWTHKSWRVREEFVLTVATAVGLFASTELLMQRVLLSPVLQLMNDSNQSVREAAISCIEEMYKNMGSQFHEELQRHNLPTYMLKEINSRLNRIEPKVPASDGTATQHKVAASRSVSVNPKRGSPRTKSTPRESTLFGGDTDITEKPVEPVRVHSEKELLREFEKIAATLVPEKDWSVRIAAMQRIEALVYGGAIDYPSFLTLLKQLIPPLSTQLADRRSTIVKQACHLLNVLSKELLGDFEPCAEQFIPMLFKLVVITVLVIAESSDTCIKTILRNCKVARILPRVADTAKNDRSAILRARCCEYALLILEYWADAPEIQRSADLYEDLIKCCVADAMSEVRSTARTCYRMFTKTWPERSRRLFMQFDPAIQRTINDEDGVHKRYASPSLREKVLQPSRTSSHASGTHMPGYGTSAIVAMDKSAAISSDSSLPSNNLRLSQSKTTSRVSDRSLESVLSSSKEKVSAIESLLKGVSISDRQNFSVARSTSLDLGVDAPSSRDPPVPLAAPASNHLSLQNSAFLDSTIPSIKSSSTRNGGSRALDTMTTQLATKERSRSPYLSNLSSESMTGLSLPYVRRSSERLQDGMDESNDLRSTRRFPQMHTEKNYIDMPYRDGAAHRDSHNNNVPNFQRPLLRKQVMSRPSASSRDRFDDSQVPSNDVSRYTDTLATLHDALSEGLNPSSDWVARVSAFDFIRNIVQQGQRGTQEIIQNFEKVMKLFFRHLDDPHHKVAQAAFSTLAEIIPACKKPFESYVERILPHVFSRLIDPKELVKKPCSLTLEIVGRLYAIDMLLPALVRSLDEQRSPKAKLAVIEFANRSFSKYTVDSEGYSNSGFLKLWLSKLAPLVNEKNAKLKEASIAGIISVYSQFDSTAVLNFILSLSVEEQNLLRRALKQKTPRIEVDLVNYLQSKKERPRPKSYDQADFGTSSEDGYAQTLKKSYPFGRYSSSSLDAEVGKKTTTVHEPTLHNVSMARTTSDMSAGTNQSLEPASGTEVFLNRSRESKNNFSSAVEDNRSWTNYPEKTDASLDGETAMSTPRLDFSQLHSPDGHNAVGSTTGKDVQETDMVVNLSSIKTSIHADNGLSIPQLLHQISTDTEISSLEKHEALQHLIKASLGNDSSVWSKYFNQILTTVLDVLGDSDPSTREIALSLIAEMLNNQKDAMEESIEIVLEKLLHVTKDVVAKISNEANRCINVLLAKYDPFRCLAVVVPLLVSDDEKILVVCINCLTKLVAHLSQEELMDQLPTFLPALFDAFSNQSPDVRKSVVFCLVDIYIMLGKAFVPYLEGLSSTQLRLVTIYANRISQARSGTAIDSANQ
ncbi:CLIP-associated protein-like isoform X1 [Triticum urartu]|uniref:TOG domain-containing protein n=1 Tax=Triticum urartu TaxID=4572 RepID=A0A8R7TKZ2_TRIUA|nr:CLIP-associated protein-like isoform X1 [Triticum urartu]XP_048558257.1 CLIP-associated protein-like isoform X1 [Triticum urartu]